MYTLPNDSYLGKYPEIDPEAFIAPGAVVQDGAEVRR